MRKIWTVGSVGLLLLVMSACGNQQPAATKASPSPVPSQAAASVSPPTSSSPLPEPSASAAPTTAPTASQVPSSSAAATTAPTASPKASAAPSVTPKIAATVPAPTAKVEANDDQAKALFKDNCMSCHGASLEGDFGPNLKKVGSQMSKADIAAQITNGGGGMPAFGKTLEAGEIEALAVWLATKK
jgi:mono/diheme cytochrome c family protein